MIKNNTVLIVGAGAVCVAVFSLFTPSGEVAANKPVLPPEPSQAIAQEELQPAIEVAEATASADALTAEPVPAPSQLWEEFIVRSGDNLSLLFKRAGFSDRDVYQIVNTAPQGKSLERIFPGQTLSFLRDERGDLAAVKHAVDELHAVTYRRMDGGFSSQAAVREPEIRQSWAVAEIDSS